MTIKATHFPSSSLAFKYDKTARVTSPLPPFTVFSSPMDASPTSSCSLVSKSNLWRAHTLVRRQAAWRRWGGKKLKIWKAANEVLRPSCHIHKSVSTVKIRFSALLPTTWLGRALQCRFGLSCSTITGTFLGKSSQKVEEEKTSYIMPSSAKHIDDDDA